MQSQREMLARAALETMLEKGVANTSNRDICARAGVTIGALYTHFKTREELILAAGMLGSMFEYEPVETWAGYEAWVRAVMRPLATDPRHFQLARMSYEFVAELVLTDTRLPAAEAEWDNLYAFFRASLAAMHRAGEIDLPLGLEATMRVHTQILSGAHYMLLADRRLDVVEVCEGLMPALALAAGWSGRSVP